jgi:hypothetical protein
MTALRKLLLIGGTTTLLAGCMHHNTMYGGSGGDVAIDSLSATRTAILRVDNAYPTDVRVYAVQPGMKAMYIGKATAGQVHTWVLDPNMFPTDKISFEARPGDGATSQTVGPLKVNKGETVELVIPANLISARANVHRSTP